jgi:hypothetical protein
MKTTLNIPDPLLKDAKRRAIDEGKTLTDLLVEGLRTRLSQSLPSRPLPVSRAGGGLVPGVDWGSLEPPEPAEDLYR